jgi:tripartite-type tricarboxylate transporter receptor subunit TctC
VKYAQIHPGQLKFGHSGIGSANHIFGEWFAIKAGINIVQVPFGGESEALAALLGGHIQIMFPSISSVLDNVKAGKVKVLAVAGEKRLINHECSNVLTFKEQGLDLVFTMWQGIAVPKMMSEEAKQKLAVVLKNIINDPEYKKNLELTGVTVEYLNHEEFKKKWILEGERLEKLVQQTGILEKIAAQKK